VYDNLKLLNFKLRPHKAITH